MAGYIMTIGSAEYLELFYAVGKNGKPRKRPKNKAGSKAEGESMAKKYALETYIRNGIYSAKTSESGGAFIGTLADYLGMKAGDNIYFFSNRKIYGIGVLKNIPGRDCRFRVTKKDQSEEKLIETNSPETHHFVCVFEPAPYFFKTGVDMDEVLTYAPEKIRSLRFFSGMSFVKLDDVENEAIKGVIARKNELYLDGKTVDQYFEYQDKVHMDMDKKIQENGNGFDLSVFDYLGKNKKGEVTSEYYLEGAIMDLLRNGFKSQYLGKWDFIARQYPASPPKPSEYMETMDLFGYRYVDGFPNAISKYLIIELKRGEIIEDNIRQTMKYVDWISKEYTHGDYSMIEAYTIGSDVKIDTETRNKWDSTIIERNYIVEGRPVKNKSWSDLKILSYSKLLDELKEKMES